jgi:hypothetical protein
MDGCIMDFILSSVISKTLIISLFNFNGLYINNNNNNNNNNNLGVGSHLQDFDMSLVSFGFSLHILSPDFLSDQHSTLSNGSCGLFLSKQRGRGLKVTLIFIHWRC